MRSLIRIAAIDFLNPAPLMWNFEHPPEASRLAERYVIERMTPSECARSLAEGRAELGLIPVGAYAATPELSIVPGCAIASKGAIRSLLLVLRAGAGSSTEDNAEEPDDEPDLAAPTLEELRAIRTVALDTSSRTTSMYTQILFRRFWEHAPHFLAHAPALDAMLTVADAAVLIGDPALHALRDRRVRRQRTGERLRYLDLGHAWHQATGTCWVSAFWAARRAGLHGRERAAIVEDLSASREAGLRHIPELVNEWAPRLELHPEKIARYLTHNIHYLLDIDAKKGLHRFFKEATEVGLIPAVPALEWFD